MTASNTQGSIRSALGEHLVVLVVIVFVVLGLLTAYPALASETKGTAARAQERVNMPLVIASELDAQSASSDSP